MDHDYMNWLLLGSFVAMILIVFTSLFIKNHSNNSQICFDDLLLGADGRISKTACVMLGAFAVTTWLLIYKEINGSSSEVYFTLYCAAWVTPTVTKIIKGEP